MAEAVVCAETRRFVSFEGPFMALFEYELPCQLRSLRQLHGPLTRANALRDAIAWVGETGKADRVIEILYTGRTMRAMGVVIDIVPSSADEKKRVKLVCHTLASVLLLECPRSVVEETMMPSAKRPSSSLQ